MATALLVADGGRQMKPLLPFGIASLVALSYAASADYTVTILKPDPLAVASRAEHRASVDLVGKSIVAIFGPLSEVRVELPGVNKTAIDGNTREVERTIRERIDDAKCLGRASEIAWHMAPWARGHVLLKDGRILPVEILLSGIVVGDLLFANKP